MRRKYQATGILRVRMSRSSERARRSPFLTRVSICTHCFSIRRVPGYERDSGCIFIIDISIQYQNHRRLVLAKITRDDDGLKNTTMFLYDRTIESWGAQLIHRCVQRLHSRRRRRECDMSMYQYLPCIRYGGGYAKPKTGSYEEITPPTPFLLRD